MNQQAQVGKTTLALGLAYALARKGQSVLAIDLDPASRLTSLCGIPSSTRGIDKVLLEGSPLLQVKTTLAAGFDVVPSGTQLIAYEQREGDEMHRAYRLKQAIETLDQQDFILIDCTSKPGLLTMSAMFAADEVLIPTTSSYLSLQGLVRVIQLFKRLKLTSTSKKIWLTLTQGRADNPVAEEVKCKLLHYFPGRVFNTSIRHDETLTANQHQNEAMVDYQQDSMGAEDYFSLAQDMIEGRVS